ncbi:MAG: hypothetical protein HOQ24_04165 [Mycobacteriaceae bacterium]|nr:hypothetical protein [Mycobacteriaceae bacterium]
MARRLLDSPNTLALELSSAGARPLHTLAPGQYAWLAVSAPDDDPNILRYSLWMAPRLGNSRLTIRLVDGFNSGFAGEASNYLHYHLYDGDSLEVGLPSNAPVCLVDRG